MNTTKTAAQASGRLGSAFDDVLVAASLECPTCSGLICLDCAQEVAHARCTRPCRDCADDVRDTAQDWRTSLVVRELAGLARVDEALRDLD